MEIKITTCLSEYAHHQSIYESAHSLHTHILLLHSHTPCYIQICSSKQEDGIPGSVNSLMTVLDIIKCHVFHLHKLMTLLGDWGIINTHVKILWMLPTSWKIAFCEEDIIENDFSIALKTWKFLILLVKLKFV